MVDTKTYYMVAPYGYRSPWTTREDALFRAERAHFYMTGYGWRGKVRVYYRDGTCVATFGQD